MQAEAKERMKRKLNTYLLLTVCLLMLVVEAFPHHHHNGALCLNTDIEMCGSASPADKGGKHQSGDEDRHTCDTTCITHFSFQSSSHHVDCTPDYAFCTLLYTLADIINQESDLSGVTKKHLYYIERLHARHFSAVRNFRAPPAA